MVGRRSGVGTLGCLRAYCEAAGAAFDATSGVSRLPLVFSATVFYLHTYEMETGQVVNSAA